jgi:hypothetical protein
LPLGLSSFVKVHNARSTPFYLPVIRHCFQPDEMGEFHMLTMLQPSISPDCFQPQRLRDLPLLAMVVKPPFVQLPAFIGHARLFLMRPRRESNPLYASVTGK